MAIRNTNYYSLFQEHLFRREDDKMICSPRNLIYDQVDWGMWQSSLRFVARDNQRYKCPVCDQFLRPNEKTELHHALISREDVRGCPRPIRMLIHHTYNCILLHHECHNINRQEGWNILTALYGEEVIINWYEGLPDKILRPNWEIYNR